MKAIFLSFTFFVSILSITYTQDTFSMVAADSSSREVGSAGASCVDLFSAGILDAGFLGDLLPDTGAINTQAYYLAANQNNARMRMRAGDSPSEIISWLGLHDVDSDATIRQYGIVRFSGKTPGAAGFTGENCMDYKNHITGSINGIYYSIQGNILLGAQVLDSMESKFKAAQGDLACRLMAALQGAKIIGADTRCAPNESSTLFAFLKVSQPSDKYGRPSFNVSVKTHSNARIEPIDTLQKLFSRLHSCLPAESNEFSLHEFFKIYPNPSGGKMKIRINNDQNLFQNGSISFFNILGKVIWIAKVNSPMMEVDLSKEKKGIYFYQLKNGKTLLKSGKWILE